MIITPIVFLTLVMGVAGMQDGGRVGRIGGKALLYFEVVSTVALVIGLAVGLLLQPGAGFNVNPATIDTSASALLCAAEPRGHAGLVSPGHHSGHLLRRLHRSAILPVLLVALLTGFAIGQLGPKAAPLLEGLAYLEKGIFAVARLVMAAAPVGAFGAMAFVIGQIRTFGHRRAAQAHCRRLPDRSAVHRGGAGEHRPAHGLSIFRIISYIKEELLIVLGTSCAESALAPLMEKMRGAGADPAVVRLVLPAGFSFNSDGTQHLYDSGDPVHRPGYQHRSQSVATAGYPAGGLATSKGVGGVTGSGFIALAATLAVVPGIPIAGLALILGIDRFLSEARAMTNVVGNAVATLVIAKWERALDLEVAGAGA